MFRHRVFPPHFKYTQGSAVKKMGVPSTVILPLLQHLGRPCVPVVSVSEKVAVGTVIADSTEFFSSPVHASISGQVKYMGLMPHPVLGHCQAVVLESDGEDRLDTAIAKRADVETLSADEVKKIVRACGIVGLGGAAFPTHVKLSPPKEKHLDTFILNGAECEPYLTSDHRLMVEYAREIIWGMKIAMKALGVVSGFIAVEENKQDAIEILRQVVDGKSIKVVSLKSFYPQGAEKQIIKTVLKREVPSGGLPFDVGVVVQNVATCFAIYEAVYNNKPLYERVITVSGQIVKDPGNILVRLGTRISDVLAFCGGLSEDPGKVIIGGPMMGIAQYTMDVPVIKGTSGILVFDKKQSKASLVQPCIRCARCLNVCPMGLNPSALAQAIEKGRYDLASEYHVADCIECGICSYVCPASRNVVGLVKLAKEKIKQLASQPGK